MSVKNVKKYRFSIDDNILVFKDLANNNYSSIFENKYLSFLKSVHEKFGTKIQLNIYYETDGFLLSEMPDKYREEWESNSDWLRLSFHAYCDDSRYQDCDYDTMKRDIELVHKEIIRFAGEKSLSYYTTLHYVACPKEGVLAMRDAGIKGLVGLYGTDEKPRIPYHLTDEISAYMRSNCFYKDEETNMFFMRNDITLNEYRMENLLDALEKHNGCEFYEIMIHEQFFHPTYKWYQGDFEEKVLFAISYLTENSYKPAFFEEIFE